MLERFDAAAFRITIVSIVVSDCFLVNFVAGLRFILHADREGIFRTRSFLGLLSSKGSPCTTSTVTSGRLYLSGVGILVPGGTLLTIR